MRLQVSDTSVEDAFLFLREGGTIVDGGNVIPDLEHQGKLIFDAELIDAQVFHAHGHLSFVSEIGDGHFASYVG
jgi:hypothetical protein